MKRQILYILLVLLAVPTLHAGSGGYWGVGLGSFALGRATAPRYQEPVYVERQVPVYVDRPSYSQSAASTSSAQVNQLRQQLQQKEAQIDSLYAENDRLKNELRESSRRLQRLQQENNELRQANSKKITTGSNGSIDEMMRITDEAYHKSTPTK